MNKKNFLDSRILEKGYVISRKVSTLIPFSGYPLNKNELFDPFFIIGSGRSGNTLLRRILDSHEFLVIPPETYVLGKAVILFKQYRKMSWKNLVYLILSQFEFHKEFPTFGISLMPLADRLIHLPKEKRSLAVIINGFYQYYAEEKKKSVKRWGDKTPVNTFHLNRINSLFPQSQYIHIIRDGCDVVSSYLESGIYDRLDSAVERWLLSVKLARKFGTKNKKKYFELKYENLVNAPEETITKICDFLNISFDKKMMKSHKRANELGDVSKLDHHQNIFNPISPDSIGKGRKKLSKKQKEILQEMIGKQMKELGYRPCF